jgi:sodium transport system ATP-binding protein
MLAALFSPPWSKSPRCRGSSIASYSCSSAERSTHASAFAAGAFDAGAARTLVNRPSPPAALAQPLNAAPAFGVEPVLVVSAVTKRWPRQNTPVLDDIELELVAGELAWLTGDNGAGKTTLLRIIAGIIAPNAGRVVVCGLESSASRRAYQRRIGLLTAGNSGLYARMTVRQNLAYWARLALLEAHHRDAYVEESLTRFELEELAGRRLDRMSMGQRQRVRIAMAFLHRPALVLLDEPANSLDDEGCAVLLEAVQEHNRSGGAALWCSPSGDGPGVSVERRLRLISGQIQHS